MLPERRKTAARPTVTPDDILAGHGAPVVETVERLRALVNAVTPEAKEVAYPGWHAIGYRHPRAGYFCGIFPAATSVKLVFEWGSLLRDERGLLAGTTKQTRHIELDGGAPIDEAGITALLLEAVDLAPRRPGRRRS